MKDVILSRPGRLRAVALDLDGVIYVGNTLMPEAAEAVPRLRQLGLKVYFVTNNSGRKREYIADKLVALGIEATADQVLTSAYAAGIFVSRLNDHKTLKVLVIGSNDLKSEIARFGATIVESAPCEILVVGFDREFSYEKICAGLNALRQNAIFIACNRDASFPAEGGQIFPGCGAMVGALEGAWGRQADYEIGKPNTILLQLIAAECGLGPPEILVVGDRLESDIAMANRFGSPSVLVTTCERAMKEHLNPDLKPTMVLASLKDLADFLC